jgi:hypothetical protein
MFENYVYQSGGIGLTLAASLTLPNVGHDDEAIDISTKSKKCGGKLQQLGLGLASVQPSWGGHFCALSFWLAVTFFNKAYFFEHLASLCEIRCCSQPESSNAVSHRTI